MPRVVRGHMPTPVQAGALAPSSTATSSILKVELTSTPLAAHTPVDTVQETSEDDPAPTLTKEPIRPTATPTMSPTPTTAGTAPSETIGPAIISFQVSPLSADPGDEVSLTWEAGGEQAMICPGARYVLFTPDDCREVPLAGTMAFTVPAAAAGFPGIYWTLTVTAGDPPISEVALAAVTFKCPTTWFFSDEPQSGVCPRTPVPSRAVIQRFEHGTIIWIEQLGRYLILEDVLLFAGEVRKGISFAHDPLPVVRDTGAEVSPPTGFYAPEGAFGSIWRGDLQDAVDYRERLGWALGPQSEYETIYQCDDAVPSGGRSWEMCYLKALDERIIVLHPLGGWYWLGEP